MANLNVEPAVEMTWDDFCRRSPPYSIALDGYVTDGPRFTHSGPHANFNHHAGVDRLATRATCAQVAVAIRQGLLCAFDDRRLEIFVNDCDEDVCLSVFLIRHAFIAQSTVNPILNRLIQLEDMLDATGGTYPLPAQMPILRQLAWIFEPYRSFRARGGLDKRNAREFHSIISDVGLRIEAHMAARGEEIELDTRYKTLFVEGHVHFVEEIGANARTGMYADGIRAFVSVRQRDEGESRWTYTIGRSSLFVKFDIPKLLSILGETEPGWGGSDIIAGSPRSTGSAFGPEQLRELVAKCVQ